ncbi:hypothetical protein B0H63DRAFT_6948 [Podospora didyma]|uniref:Uncharacterized protein n=1 Tax=Podospora didyma TaxID=330526 RepID=A0AAE0P4V5_9PEZI|nr:hypothetical protein B0H63DRAFT_6948 [Podospora didyma]
MDDADCRMHCTFHVSLLIRGSQHGLGKNDSGPVREGNGPSRKRSWIFIIVHFGAWFNTMATKIWNTEHRKLPIQYPPVPHVEERKRLGLNRARHREADQQDCHDVLDCTCRLVICDAGGLWKCALLVSRTPDGYIEPQRRPAQCSSLRGSISPAVPPSPASETEDIPLGDGCLRLATAGFGWALGDLSLRRSRPILTGMLQDAQHPSNESRPLQFKPRYPVQADGPVRLSAPAPWPVRSLPSTPAAP